MSLKQEVLWYWTLSRKVQADVSSGEVSADDIDEFDVLASYTDSPTLRRLCNSAVAQHTKVSAVVGGTA